MWQTISGEEKIVGSYKSDKQSIVYSLTCKIVVTTIMTFYVALELITC